MEDNGRFQRQGFCFSLPHEVRKKSTQTQCPRPRKTEINHVPTHLADDEEDQSAKLDDHRQNLRTSAESRELNNSPLTLIPCRQKLDRPVRGRTLLAQMQLKP